MISRVQSILAIVFLIFPLLAYSQDIELEEKSKTQMSLKESLFIMRSLAPSSGSGRAGGNPGDLERYLYVLFNDGSEFELDNILNIRDEELETYVNDLIFSLKNLEIVGVEIRTGRGKNDPVESLFAHLDDPIKYVARQTVYLIEEVYYQEGKTPPEESKSLR